MFSREQRAQAEMDIFTASKPAARWRYTATVLLTWISPKVMEKLSESKAQRECWQKASSLTSMVETAADMEISTESE